MSDESLTYRSSGVDVEENLEANRRIQAFTQRTFNNRVLSRTGLFGGAISLTELSEPLVQPALIGRLSAAEGESPEIVSRRIAQSCRSRSSISEVPLAFLDYLAAARLDANRAADLVGIFSGEFAASPKIPIIGGETAEMPDVFQAGGWEVVGALFALAEVGSAPDRQVSLTALQTLARPSLVFSMDGVGTKTKLGMMTRKTAGLALDIIHHCLNDILCQGARGTGLMLYLGCHHRDERLIEPLFAAAEQCCRSNDLVLLDHMVTEKPDLYLPGEIDLCAAIAGTVDAEGLIQGDTIQVGDQIIGLLSSGLHTNGYSLARKALLDRGGLKLDQRIGELGCTLGEALLEPHRNYAPVVLPLLENAESAPAVKGIAHITGGGLKDNLGRILPGKLEAEIYLDRWQPPPIFELIRRTGNIPVEDPVGKGMYESFNMGIGLVLVVAPEYSGRILERFKDGGYQAVVIGRVIDSPLEKSGRRSTEQSERVRLL